MLKNNKIQLLGIIMLIWYSCIRWTMFKDHTVYWWAYEHINMQTSDLSVLFLVPTILKLDKILNINLRIILTCLGFYLFVRNGYYTIEDIGDFFTNPLLQTFFIVIDLMMAIYCWVYFRKTYRLFFICYRRDIEEK